MGIHDRSYYRDEYAEEFHPFRGGIDKRSMVVMLIIINVAVFVLDAFSNPAGEATVFCRFLSLSDLHASEPWNWWRVLTAAFAHRSARHIIGNMLLLFIFGRPIEHRYGSKKFLWMYLTAAVAANLVWLAIEIAKPGVSPYLLGASGATTAVFVLFCILYPHRKLRLLLLPHVGIPAWVLGAIIVGGDLLGSLGLQLSSEDDVQVAFIVHLAGAGYAFLFSRTQWTADQLLPGPLLRGLKKAVQPGPRLKVHRPSSSQADDIKAQGDRILEKLYKEGEASLTRRERKILEEYSRTVRQQK